MGARAFVLEAKIFALEHVIVSIRVQGWVWVWYLDMYYFQMQ
jgi:hypothetical protein